MLLRLTLLANVAFLLVFSGACARFLITEESVVGSYGCAQGCLLSGRILHFDRGGNYLMCAFTDEPSQFDGKYSAEERGRYALADNNIQFSGRYMSREKNLFFVSSRSSVFMIDRINFETFGPTHAIYRTIGDPPRSLASGKLPTNCEMQQVQN